MLRLLFILLLFIVTLSEARNLKRCRNYIQDVRKFHYEAFGVDFPFHFGVGQLETESACRNVISKDGVGSQGLPQITWKVWKKFLIEKNIFNLNSIPNQLRAQAWIMWKCKKMAYSTHLWVAYQIYNGGLLVNQEIKRARRDLEIHEIPWHIAKLYCLRRKIKFNNGQMVDACKINYDYSLKVFMNGLSYKEVDTNKFEFW